MSKKSIRFFNDRQVRAVWDDENNYWWFSATDVLRVINDETAYTKAVTIGVGLNNMKQTNAINATKLNLIWK